MKISGTKIRSEFRNCVRGIVEDSSVCVCVYWTLVLQLQWIRQSSFTSRKCCDLIEKHPTDFPLHPTSTPLKTIQEIRDKAMEKACFDTLFVLNIFFLYV